MQNGKTILNLTKFRQKFHPVWAKMMANLFRRGISALHIDNLIDWTNICANEKAEDIGFRHIQTIYQGDTSLYFGGSINE
jgi:hypothetical protein